MSQQQLPGQAQVAQALGNAVAQGVNQLAQATPYGTWAALVQNGHLQAQAAAQAQAQAQAQVQAQAQPARTYQVTPGAEQHYDDARGGNDQWGLPTSRQELIDQVEHRWDDFEDQGGDEWMLDLGEVSTRRDPVGDYSDRAWSIVLEMRPGNVVRIFHFGPTG